MKVAMMVVVALNLVGLPAEAIGITRIKPDVDVIFPMGDSKGQITYRQTPVQIYQPSAFEIWDGRIFVVNGHVFKVLEFDHNWKFIKETTPQRLLVEDQDYQAGALYSNGAYSLFMLKTHQPAIVMPDLSAAETPKLQSPNADEPMLPWDDYLAQYELGLDSIYWFKNHYKVVRKSNAAYITDQAAVRDYLLERMARRTFLSRDTALASFLVDLNWQSDSVITDRYSTIGEYSKYPERAAAFEELMSEVFKRIGGMTREQFQSQIDGELVLDRVTDYGFILYILKDEPVINRMFVKIDLISNTITFSKFEYPDNINGLSRWTFDEDGEYFYAMALTSSKTWDLLRFPLRASPSSTALSTLTASSTQIEPTDKNAYHLLKLFDGDPKTMWIENAKGPGIGESVTVGFEAPITADEIQFMPGAFWKEYWKQNYRVKSLEVKLDDKIFSAAFKDAMTVQSLKLSSPVTFKTAVFTIKGVYPTTKWEDTAISEITFYNQGVKVDVDYSKFKEFLKKAP